MKSPFEGVPSRANPIIRKTLVYSLVTGALTCVYLGMITVVAHLFEGFAGYKTIFSSALAAALITICFQPLIKRVQAFVDGKFFRQYVDREEKLYELSREVLTHTTQEALSAALVRVIKETIHPQVAGLYLRHNNGSGFICTAGISESHLPLQMEESNALKIYFVGHPQPFLQDLEGDLAESQDTRRALARGKNVA